ncbi:MAG: hypothetical protein MUW56_10640 [Chryseobacterium sp.]|uniref:hypothetical protein n=1 Tax=Chryseobacterium sp. TaxID=1871047 RepID=UPI0025B9E5F4|nr:hypothetical protein [Chryseobacterium sp.]MCJ7934069.1 hypothetical protein [Chryseobacterium sp.]
MEIKKGLVEITEDESRMVVDERFLLINFPVKKAVKINQYYDKIRNKEKQHIQSEIQNLAGFSEEAALLWSEKEAFEKLLTVTYSLLKKNPVLMVYTAGISPESTSIYKNMMKDILEDQEDKSLYLVRNAYTFTSFEYQ